MLLLRVKNGWTDIYVLCSNHACRLPFALVYVRIKVDVGVSFRAACSSSDLFVFSDDQRRDRYVSYGDVQFFQFVSSQNPGWDVMPKRLVNSAINEDVAVSLLCHFSGADRNNPDVAWRNYDRFFDPEA